MNSTYSFAAATPFTVFAIASVKRSVPGLSRWSASGNTEALPADGVYVSATASLSAAAAALVPGTAVVASAWVVLPDGNGTGSASTIVAPVAPRCAAISCIPAAQSAAVNVGVRS
eukprot:SAG11_NODE_942_length_6435_cov_27.522096_5_plen_115_part_00